MHGLANRTEGYGPSFDRSSMALIGCIEDVEAIGLLDGSWQRNRATLSGLTPRLASAGGMDMSGDCQGLKFLASYAARPGKGE